MIVDALESELKKVVEDRLRDPAQRKQVVTAVMTAFSALRMKPSPDLGERIKTMQKRVERMVEDLSVQYLRGELVVKVAGSAESLLCEFRLGSDWFAPEPDIDKIIVAATLVDPKT